MPRPEKVNAHTTPARRAKLVLPRLASKLVDLHLVPPAQPLDVLTVRINGEIAVLAADGAVAFRHGALAGRLRVQGRMEDFESDGAAVAAACHCDVGELVEELLEGFGGGS